VRGFPGAGHALWIHMKTGLAVQGAFPALSSTGPTPLVPSQWMNALVSKFSLEDKLHGTSELAHVYVQCMPHSRTQNSLSKDSSMGLELEDVSDIK